MDIDALEKSKKDEWRKRFKIGSHYYSDGFDDVPGYTYDIFDEKTQAYVGAQYEFQSLEVAEAFVEKLLDDMWIRHCNKEGAVGP